MLIRINPKETINLSLVYHFLENNEEIIVTFSDGSYKRINRDNSNPSTRERIREYIKQKTAATIVDIDNNR
jgi:hypothetical protein